MKKRTATLIGLVYLALLISPVFNVSAQSVSIAPASIEAEQGDTFTINIQVDPKDDYIYGAQYVLYFDSNILNASSQTQGTFLSQDGASSKVFADIINNTIGKLEYVESRMSVEQGVTNSGRLASITFEVIGTSGTSYFEFSDVLLSDSDGVEIQNVTISPGSFSIKQEADHSPVSQSNINSIVVEKAREMMEENAAEIILLDVRTKAEYEAEHIDMPGVELRKIPKDELESRLGELDKTGKIIVYCRTGGGSRTASEILVRNGFENVYNMLGGIEEWTKFQFPVFRQPTSTSAITATPSAAQSPSPTEVVSPEVSPAVSATSTPTSLPEGKRSIPGFEVGFAITGLLAMAYIMYKRKRR